MTVRLLVKTISTLLMIPPTCPRLTLRTILLAAIGLFLGCLVLVYVIYQARFLILGPMIELTDTNPSKNNQQIITLTGTARNITRLWLNDRLIYTDQAGNFNEALLLENGYTIATLRAEDRYGRMTRIKREFVYTPATLIQ